jgi:hypothetical protein
VLRVRVVGVLLGFDQAFVVNRWMAGVISALALVLVVAIAHVLIVTSSPAPEASDLVAVRRRGIKALVIGADGRASTSKLQVVLWTIAVLYAFTFLLVWGRSSGCGDEDVRDGPRCREAAAAREAFRDAVNSELQPEYYVLLGFPVAAAVAAKALTTNKVASGELTKAPLTENGGGLVQGAAEVVSNDRGEGDIGDFQYLAFNLLALGWFTLEFASHPAAGLPDLPPTLTALTGFAAAAYTTKKALERDVRPAISAVVPRRSPRVEGAGITVVGTGFGTAGPGPENAAPEGAHVMLNGCDLTIATGGWRDSRIIASLSRSALAALPESDAESVAAEITVMDCNGLVSDPATLELYVPGKSAPMAVAQPPPERATPASRAAATKSLAKKVPGKAT